MAEGDLGPSEADLSLLRESIAPVLAEECDSLAVHGFVEGHNDLASSLWRRATELGWLSIGLPEELGGYGFGLRGSQLLNVELGRAVAPGAYIAALAAAHVMAEHGDSALRQEWLSQVAGGTATIAIAATPADAPCLARDGNLFTGRAKLLGEMSAALALIPASPRELLVVDIEHVSKVPLALWDRTRSVLEVALDRVEPVAVIADDGQAARALTRTAAIAVAADSIGLGHGIIAKTIAYLKEREQFGRPIGSFQALKHRVVDMVARIGVAEHVVDQAVEVAAVRSEAADMWASMAKVVATEAATFVAGDCVQLFGGVGYTWEYDVHLYLKRARLNEMLIAGNGLLADQAALDLERETQAGRSVLELATL